MKLTTSLCTCLTLLTTTLITTTTACVPENIARRQNADAAAQYPAFNFGSDNASDPATKGYFINHLCINVRNATESIDFYTRAFGMRLIFTLQLTEHASISYMGHAAGGKNGTGYQTVEEMNRDKNNREGLLELVSFATPNWNLPASSAVPNTFSHIGMVVPDIEAAQKRLDEVGANTVKRFGTPLSATGAVANATGAGDLSQFAAAELEAVFQALVVINTPLIWVADPDGNLIEIQGAEGFALDG